MPVLEGPCGVIEGFYGGPWSWDDRLAVARWCAARGLPTYLYAPKDDPRHRERWREPYPAAELDGFARLAGEDGVRLGFGISPGLSIDAADPADRAALAAKCRQVVGVGAELVCLALDDLDPRPGLGEEHAALTAWLRDELDGAVELLLVPTHYVGTDPAPYLDALVAGAPACVPVAWTGPQVVCGAITAEQARARAAAVGGRRPWLWDNVPVNDAFMADRLHLGPLRGRDPELRAELSGYLANPMVQPRASLLPLASVAAWARGDDPERAWAAEAGELRPLAEACDGEVPLALVAHLVDAVEGGDPRWREAADALGAWLDRVGAATTGWLGDEADGWLRSAQEEAACCRSALGVVTATLGDPPDPATASLCALAAMVQWPLLGRTPHTTFGARRSVRPALGQDRASAWVATAGCFEQGANATDRLVALAASLLPPP